MAPLLHPWHLALKEGDRQLAQQAMTSTFASSATPCYDFWKGKNQALSSKRGPIWSPLVSNVNLERH